MESPEDKNPNKIQFSCDLLSFFPLLGMKLKYYCQDYAAWVNIFAFTTVFLSLSNILGSTHAGKSGNHGIPKALVYISPCERNSGRKIGHSFSLLQAR